MSSSPTDVHNGRPPAPKRGAIEVPLPQIGVSIAEAKIVEWRKTAGERVEPDEIICVITSDKVDTELPAPVGGTLTAVLAGEGETVAVGEPICVIEPAGASGDGEGGAESVPDRSGFISPVVRRMAEKHGIDLEAIEGTGVGGRIRKADLIAHLTQRDKEPARPLHTESPYREEEAATAAQRRVRLSEMRRSIGEHMRRSLDTSAHCTTVIEVDFSRVAEVRELLAPGFAERGVKLTYLAFVASATVAALLDNPRLNSSLGGEEIVEHGAVHLGVAVALDDGLIVPVLRNAERLNLEGLAAAIGDVAGRARAGRLHPDEVQGGTFTITNPGAFGTVLATPIINQPQVAILDLEAIVRRPVVVGEDGGEAIAIRPIGNLCLSWDHRALDGVDAARFLAAIRERVEDWKVDR